MYGKLNVPTLYLCWYQWSLVYFADCKIWHALINKTLGIMWMKGAEKVPYYSTIYNDISSLIFFFMAFTWLQQYFFEVYLSILLLRKRESTNRGGAQRERETQNPSRPWALSCQHGARHGARTHKQQDHDPSWSHTLNQLSHPGSLISVLIWALMNVRIHLSSSLCHPYKLLSEG